VDAVDTVGIGQLAAQIQASEAERGRVVRMVERQGQMVSALMDMATEAMGALKAVKDGQGSAEERLPGLLDEGIRKAYAAGYTDALAQGNSGRPLRSV
jgi:hypothetical protein